MRTVCVHVLAVRHSSPLDCLSVLSPLRSVAFSNEGSDASQEILWVFGFGIEPVASHRGYGVAFVCAAHEHSGNLQETARYAGNRPSQNWTLPFRMLFHSIGEKVRSFPSVAN